jgi:cell division protein FtsQ
MRAARKTSTPKATSPGAKTAGASYGARSAPPPPQAPPRRRVAQPALRQVGPSLRPQTAFTLALMVVACGVILMLITGGRARALLQHVETATAGRLAGLGFQVKTIELEGASRFSIPYILSAAGVDKGAPTLGLDLDAIRARVEKVGWVKSVRVLRLMPDTLVIAVDERPRLAVWQTGGKSYVIDPDGRVIPEADPGLFIDLPLIVGPGANTTAAPLLQDLVSRPRLMSRLEALVRVDGRRWDLRLKDGSLIQLPADNQDNALIQLDQLDQKDRLLDLGFERIDLRDPEMIAVRPRPAGPVQSAQAAPPPPSAAPPSAGPSGRAATQPASE